MMCLIIGIIIACVGYVLFHSDNILGVIAIIAGTAMIFVGILLTINELIDINAKQKSTCTCCTCECAQE